MLQSTDALTFQAGDLEALNLLLNHSLARLADAEVAGEGGRGRDGGDDGVAGGGGSTSSAGGQDQCWKAKRVQQDVCRRHSVADKILRIMSEQHEAQLDSRVAACRHEQRVADPRSLPRQFSRGLADTCVASGLGFPKGDPASYHREYSDEAAMAEEEAAEDEWTHNGAWQTRHLPPLSGIDMNLGKVLPDIAFVANRGSDINFQASVLHLSSFSEAERSIPPAPILPEDSAPFNAALGYNSSETFVTRHGGLVLAAVHNVTVVHDGVVCNSTHAITALGVKHKEHPPVHDMHGCSLADEHPAIRHCRRALLLVRYMGWFWGHFCQDLLHRLAFASEIMDERMEGFDIILESRSHANVLALVQAVVGGAVNARVLFMPTACLRGNARMCPYYFRAQELLLVEIHPTIINTHDSPDDISDAVPPGIRLAKRRISSFFDVRLAELESMRRNHRDRDAPDRVSFSGSSRATYAESGECSVAKAQPLTAGVHGGDSSQGAGSGEDSRGWAPRGCRGLGRWLTAYQPLARVSAYQIIYLGRGTTPCTPGRTRCMSNAASLVEMLNVAGLLLSTYQPGDVSETARRHLAPTQGVAEEMVHACVHINREVRTHTFMETVALMRQARLVVGMQGSQNFNLIFASTGTLVIEMVPVKAAHRAESNRIFLSSLGVRVAILPIYGISIQEATSFTIDPCRVVRLLNLLQNDIHSPLQRCHEWLQLGPPPHMPAVFADSSSSSSSSFFSSSSSPPPRARHQNCHHHHFAALQQVLL